jgi:hypothetical protein
MKPCHFCHRPAYPLCDTYARDEAGNLVCWDCAGQRDLTDEGYIWVERTWIGLDGKRHGGYPDPRKVQGRLFP